MKESYRKFLINTFIYGKLSDEEFNKCQVAFGIIERAMEDLGIMTTEEILEANEF